MEAKIQIKRLENHIRVVETPIQLLKRISQFETEDIPLPLEGSFELRINPFRRSLVSQNYPDQYELIWPETNESILLSAQTEDMNNRLIEELLYGENKIRNNQTLIIEKPHLRYSSSTIRDPNQTGNSYNCFQLVDIESYSTKTNLKSVK